jgi:hypothetical protein
MKFSKSFYELSFSVLVLTAIGLFIPHTIFCQTEKLDIVEYTPPKGWTKTPKAGVMIYTNSNKEVGSFCVLSVYPSAPSVGSPQKDFADQWNALIVKRLRRTQILKPKH